MNEQQYLNQMSNALNNTYAHNSSFSNFTNVFDKGLANAIDGSLDYARELEQMKIQNSFNAWQSNLAWERQKESAQSQYQWAVEDMRKAGLNPYLAYSNGGNQVGSVPTTANAGFSSQNKGKQTANLIGGILTTLLGSAFKIATTSMIGESQMAQTLQRVQSSKEISNAINQNRLDIERLRKQTQSQRNFTSNNRRYTDKQWQDIFNSLKDG